MLSGGDSGGGLFIQDAGVWKLSGINYSVGPLDFSYNSDGSGSFPATLYNYSRSGKFADDLYYKNGSVWNSTYNKDDVPCSFYSTRISSRYSWITNNIPDFDQDVDGLPDWWESSYGNGPTAMNPADNLDSDGFSNYEEWIADTDPTNGASYFEIVEWLAPTNVTFSSSAERQYQIEYRADLLNSNEAWQAEAPGWFEGFGSQTVQDVSSSPSNRFYRIRAKVR